MSASTKHPERARTDLSLCVVQLEELLATVRMQESFLSDRRSPYFDETIVLAHSHLDGAMRALRGIVARLDDGDG